jgi:hypothetical protein
VKTPARYHEIVSYLQSVADVSDRATLSRYGRTRSGRELHVLTLSSAANLARLPRIEEQLRQLGDGTLSEAKANEIAASLPAIVWLGCGIHGDEISGPDAALEVIRRLTADSDPHTLELLDKLVIHVDAMVNPDGRERFLAHVTAYSRRVGALDPQDLLHNVFWPEGRGNHYLFDLNRDAIFTVQAESRARVIAITAAQPQLFIDAHEMAAADTYLFAVPADPLNPHLPSTVHDSWRDFAVDHAEAFDKDGTSFYTRSWNEVFYPGFFDIWPAYHGAVPILYEQSATSGSAVQLPNGKVRTYDEAVSNQVRSALANLGTAARAKNELLRRWAAARALGASSGAAQKAWIVPPADAHKTRRLVELLQCQGIRVEQLAAPLQASGLHGAWDDQARELALPEGTLLIRCGQPLGALVRNIFDFHVPVTPEFAERERRGIDLGAKTLIFDVTAWSLPFAFGLDAFWTSHVPAGEWRVLERAAAVQKKTALPASRYGFLYRDPSMHATARLLARGVRIRVACEAFTAGDQRFEPGTMLLRHDDQSTDIAAALHEELVAGDVQFVPADSARIFDGPDLGGREFELLTAPAVAVFAGHGLNAPGFGALWHLFDESIGVPVTLLDIARLPSLDLGRYNVIVLGETTDTAVLTKAGLEKLNHWVHNGGTLIALSGGALALAEAGFTACKLRRPAIRDYPPLMFGRRAAQMLGEDFVRATGALEADESTSTPPVVGAAARAFVPADAPRFEVLDRAPTLNEWLNPHTTSDRLVAEIAGRLCRCLPRGAYVRADFKPMHWLRFGVPDRLPMLFREADVLIADGGVDVVARYAAPRELALSGLIWPEALGYIAGTACVARERLGSGQVVLFANDPVFRGYSLGTQRLLLNAVLLGPAFRAV